MSSQLVRNTLLAALGASLAACGSSTPVASPLPAVTVTETQTLPPITATPAATTPPAATEFAAAAEPTQSAAAPVSPPAKAVAEGFTMPSVTGLDLQSAQDAVQVAAGGFFISTSTDLSGQGRNQVLDANWQVCQQTPAPGSAFAADDKVDFGVVRISESCP